MVISTWGMSEEGLHAVEEQGTCAMPNKLDLLSVEEHWATHDKEHGYS